MALGIAARATGGLADEVPLSSGWPAYGGTNAGTRYSTLSEINRDTVGRLALAWTYRTGDVSDGSWAGAKSTFEATPILAFSRLYFCTPFNRVIALDPDTGREIWKHDPRIDLAAHYSNDLVCRGVAAWSDGSAHPPATCRDRIFTATNDARLISLDAATGQRCKGFGTEGTVDLTTGVGRFQWSGEYQVTSPPLVLGDLVVVGSAISDNWRVDAPSGVVRAFDVRTGALRWWWNGARRSREGPDAFMLGTPNAWAPLSGDAERGLVFVPTGNASPDFFGAQRGSKGDFASSVVALRVATGEVAWHFQTVHHDVWDYDVSSQPALLDLRLGGELVPAVVQATKMGLLFVLERETGRAIFPVEERPVPTNGVPGEALSPTQPFPVRPAALVPHFLGIDDIWGLTPFDRAWCRRRLAELRSEGIYTPPSVRGSVEFPGITGGVNWGSVAFDPREQRLFANASSVPYVIRLVPRSHYDVESKRERGAKGDIRPQLGTPFGVVREPFLSPLGVPCNQPPWGNLSAVDMASGEIRWTAPLGTIRDLTPLPLPLKWGVPNVGGPIVTAGGLVFIAAALDDYLRAFDSDTGALVWEARLPAGGQATPMTFRGPSSGRQFVVIAAGGHGRAGTRLGDHLVAFALAE